MLVLHKYRLMFPFCGPAAYFIDTVGLAILPSKNVPSGTPVNITCKVIVIRGSTQNLNHTFQISRHDALIYTFTTKEDTVTYKLNPARAADSGSYQCRVSVKEKSKPSYSEKLIVTGSRGRRFRIVLYIA